ncbi:efflux RND transporter permease subunit [Agarilytica rhodophyticola]|uniref:efflux RND transporter permease subunit n=1 Tax=Agarilytica rhodophyticola TaxID=1737490 RepID=UPI000B342AA6|nr:efflux RND transporter permease subunit [Agarilytica rhodophyticola]
MQDSLNEKIYAYTEFVIRWRWLVMAISIMASLALMYGAQNLAFDNDYRSFFSEENSHLKAFDEQQKTYTKNDNILFTITPDSGEVFTPEVLSAVEEVTTAAWQLPFALRVDSISNFQYSHAQDDDLIVEDLIEGALNYTPEQLLEKKRIALAAPFIVGQLLNPQASVTAVNITFQMPELSPDEAPQAVTAARELKEKIEKKYPVKVHMTGVVMLSNAFFEASIQDFMTLTPAMYLIIILTITFLLRSIGATVATVLVIVFSVAASMGAAGWLGVKLTPPSFASGTIIMTLAVADSIHILTTLFSALRKGMSREEAIHHSMRLNIGPVFLTSVTTAVGFLSMNTSDAPPFHDLGNITAIGVMWAFVLSVTFLPAILATMSIKARSSGNKFEHWMELLGEFVIRKRKAVFVSAGLFAILIVSAIPLNVFDDNFVAYFDDSVQFRVDTDYVNDNLTGVYQIQYSLSSGEDYGVSNPVFMKKVEAFVTWMRKNPDVTHVNTFTDTLKRINKNMHADNQEYYRLPEEKDLSAQYVLLYELSLPEGLDLNNQMDIGKSATQIIVTVKDMPSSQIASIAEAGREWLLKEQKLDAYGTGPAVMFAYISDTNMRNMLYGTAIAIVIISMLITVSLRNLRIGALSLIPNLLPIAMAFGLWGLIDGQVNVAVSMVTGMALGIVVDDSVHFLSKYLRARREKGLSREHAVRYAFSTVGIAIVVTSIVLVAGFAVLGQSSFGMNSNMAILTAIAIAMALLADFLLLPVLLLKFDKHQTADEFDQQDSPTSDTEKKETHYA